MTLFDAPIHRHRITARAAADACPHCGASTISGLEDILGLPEYVDPDPVTPPAELAAILTGRPTYTIAAGELLKRDANRIAHASADAEPVYVRHSCVTGAYPRNPRHPPPRPPATTYTDPPF